MLRICVSPNEVGVAHVWQMSYQDVDAWIATLFAGGKLEEAQVKSLCERAKEILAKESNVTAVRRATALSNRIAIIRIPNALFLSFHKNDF